jgi:hypothetical protein
LLDAGLAESSDVRQTLVSIGSFANLPAPAPSAELAAMLAGPHDEVTKRRWRHKHRTAVVSVAVVAAMGLGVSGVAAASSGFTRNPAFIDELLGKIAPQWSAEAPLLPAPDAPKVSTVPAPVADPAAVPPATPATEIPLSATAAPAAGLVPPSAQDQDQDQDEDQAAGPAVPAPAQNQADQNPAELNPGQNTQSKENQSGENQVRKNQAKENQAKPDNAKPGQGGPQRFDTQKPNMPQGNMAQQGKPGGKTGQTLPSLTNQRSGEHFKAVMDKLKQWKKRGDR